MSILMLYMNILSFPNDSFHRDQGFSSVAEAVGADHRGADGSTHKQNLRKETLNVDTGAGDLAPPVASISSDKTI